MSDKVRFKNANLRTLQGAACLVDGDKLVDHRPQQLTGGACLIYPVGSEPIADPEVIREILAGHPVAAAISPEAVVTQASVNEAIRKHEAEMLP